MTLTEILETWINGAERMHGGAVSCVVITRELFTQLLGEQSQESPSVSGLDVFVAASETPTGEGLLPLSEMVEIAGPDGVSIDVGARPSESTFPLDHDPAMPAVFVPLPPNAVDDPAALELYNRLRWMGLGPEETLAGARPVDGPLPGLCASALRRAHRLTDTAAPRVGSDVPQRGHRGTRPGTRPGAGESTLSLPCCRSTTSTTPFHHPRLDGGHRRYATARIRQLG